MQKQISLKFVQNYLTIKKISSKYFIFIKSIIFIYSNNIHKTYIQTPQFSNIYYNGKTARKYKIVSKFGSVFDSISDKVFVVGILVVMVSERLYPQWSIYAVLIILAREFLISGLRIMAAAKGRVLSAEKSGKIKTAVTMVAICITIGTKVIEEEMDIYNFKPQILVQINQYLYLISLGLYILSSVLALQSAYSYLSKYGYMMFESDQDDSKKNN